MAEQDVVARFGDGLVKADVGLGLLLQILCLRRHIHLLQTRANAFQIGLGRALGSQSRHHAFECTAKFEYVKLHVVVAREQALP